MTEAEATQQFNDWVAERLMGWECLQVGCFYDKSDTPRQYELSDWMRRVGVDRMGRYYVDVATDFWIKAEDWQPAVKLASEAEVLDYMSKNGSQVSLQWDDDCDLWRCSWLCEGQRLEAWATHPRLAVYEAVMKALTSPLPMAA